MTNMFSLLASTLFFSFSLPDSNEFSKSVYIPLDCSNYCLFNFIQNSNEHNLTPVTYAEDTVFSRQEYSNKSNVLRLWADLGSESGEYLFSRLKGESAINREHMTFAGSEIDLLNNKIKLRGGFRHLGSYADRLENSFGILSSKYKQDLTYKDIGDYAISEYYFGAFKANFQNANIKGALFKYGNWVSQPVTYDPVYQSGYKYLQEVAITLPKTLLTLNSDLDFQKRYWNHRDHVDINNYFFDVKMKRQFTDNLSITGKVNSKSDNLTMNYFALIIENELTDKINWFLETGAWDNFKTSAIFWGGWEPVKNFKYDLTLKYKYKPGEIETIYWGLKSVTKYRSDPIYEKEMYSSIAYCNILQLPLHAQGWFDIKKGNEQYFINNNADTLEVTKGLSEELLVAVGGKIYADFELNNVAFKPWVQGNHFLKYKLPESFPFESGIEMSYEMKGSNPAKLGVSFTYRKPYRWRALKNGEPVILRTSSLLFSQISASVPFVSPIFTDNLKPSFQISAGPVHLLDVKEKRQKFHPLGSEMGPAIHAQINSDILIQ